MGAKTLVAHKKDTKTVPSVEVDIRPVYRKIARSGSARYLSVTQQVPKDWQLVELQVTSLEGNILMLQIRKVV